MQWSGALPPHTEQLSTLSDGTHSGGRDLYLQHLLTSLRTLRRDSESTHAYSGFAVYPYVSLSRLLLDFSSCWRRQ